MKYFLLTLALASFRCTSNASSDDVVCCAIPVVDQWQVYEADGAFRVGHPESWAVAQDEQGRVTITGPAGETVVIWPLYVAQPMTEAAAGALLRRMVERLSPGLRWGTPQTVDRDVVRMVGGDDSTKAVAGFSWASRGRDTGGYLIDVSGPADAYEVAEPTFVRILESFSVTPAPDAAGQARPIPAAYVRWQDPYEHAFSVEVPQGWPIEGGLIRMASVDTRTVIRLHSPEGSVQLFAGDADLPPFTVPTQMLTFSGFPEGATYSPGYGVQMQVRRYLPGAAFARSYAQKVATGCTGLRFTEVEDRPEADRRLNEISARYGAGLVQQQMNSGEARFTCTRGGQTFDGYVFATTMLTQAPSMGAGGIWTVQYLYGYLTSAGQRRQAEEHLAHMVASVQLNPQWVQMQQGLTGNVSRIVADTGDYISGLIDDVYQNRQAAQDRSNRRFSNYIRGVEDFVDPQTGITYQVSSGPRYRWIDALGDIVGTDLYENPNALRFREMIHVR